MTGSAKSSGESDNGGFLAVVVTYEGYDNAYQRAKAEG